MDQVGEDSMSPVECQVSQTLCEAAAGEQALKWLDELNSYMTTDFKK